MSHDAFVLTESDPLRGRLIADKYRVIDRVGQGGMGTVYRAVQSGLNRHVALKILKRELTFDPDTVARFQREANALSLLTHPNTVRVYDFGQTSDGLLFLVMELLEGEVITDKLAREGVLDVLDSVRTAQQILRSLSEAHQHAIVHRDLKPDNIFIARLAGHVEPVVKVLDFGIAKIAAPDRVIDQFETQAGTVFGTPRYMSPEQAQGAALDARSDLYSVGTLLYLMLTGRAPFVDDDAVVVMAKHIREMPEGPRVAAPDRPIPKSLEDVVMRSLAKAPDDRFQSAAEFDAALEACVREITSLAARPGNRMQTDGRLKVALAAAALVALGYGGFRAASALTSSSAIAAAPLTVQPALRPAPAPIPVVTQDSEPAAAQDPEEQVLAEGPGPANVHIRSEPPGATVFRNGERLGETPMYLLVQPDQELVRIELRKGGFLPLAAELTARDGERVLKLAPAAAEEPPRRRGATPKRQEPERVGKPAAPPSSPPVTQPEPSLPKPGPYERFE